MTTTATINGTNLEQIKKMTFDTTVKFSVMVIETIKGAVFTNRDKDTDRGLLATFEYNATEEEPITGEEVVSMMEKLSAKTIEDMYRTVNRTYIVPPYQLAKNIVVKKDGSFVIILKTNEYRTPINKQYGAGFYQGFKMIQEIEMYMDEIKRLVL